MNLDLPSATNQPINDQQQQEHLAEVLTTLNQQIIPGAPPTMTPPLSFDLAYDDDDDIGDGGNAVFDI